MGEISAGMRGVLNRGLAPQGPVAEPLVCTATINLEPLSSQPEPEEIRRLLVLSSTYATFRDGTACLLRLASILELSASNELFVASPDAFFDVVGAIVDICETIIGRTRTSYRLFADTQTYQPLDTRVLSFSPVKDYLNWKSLKDQRKAILAGRALVRASIPIAEHPIAISDKDGWRKAMDAVEHAAATALDAAQVTAPPDRDMPLVSTYLGQIKAFKFSDLERQSRARYGYGVSDDQIYGRVELMIYHSVYSVLLDNAGNPAFLPGFPYALLIPKPGVPMERRMQPPGLYLGTGKLADYQFAVDRKDPRKVKSILFGGIGGLTETLNTFSWEHELHTQLQQHIDFTGIYVVPVIVAPEAFNSGELTIGKAYDRMPEIVEHTARHVYAEIVKRLGNLYENYPDILKQVGADIVKDIIIDQVKSWAIDYLVKKLGKKIIPVVNVVSALAEALDDEELAMTRAALTALVMAVKSTRADDMTISSKVLGKIGADKVQARVVQELSKRGAQLVKKGAGAAKAKIAPKTAKPDAPASADEPHVDTTAAKDAQATANDAKAANGTTDGKPRRPESVAEEMQRVNREAQAYRDALAKSRATGADANGTAAKGKPSPATRPDEPPLPPSAKEASSRQQLEFLRQNKKAYSKDVQQMIDAQVLHEQRKTPVVDKAGGTRVNQAIDKANRRNKTKQHASIPDGLSPEARIEYLKQHRDEYPANVQKAIDKEIERAEAPTKGSIAKIDKAIRDEYAQKLTDAWGIPVTSVSRMPKSKGEDTSGSDWEKTNIALREGRRPDLSATSATKAGEPVQMDDFDAGRRVPREYKASLEIAGKDAEVGQHEIEQRMKKHAEFAEDYDLPKYEWVAHSPGSKEKMETALTSLQVQASNERDPAVAARLKKRYEKIKIVEEFYLDDQPPRKKD